MSLQKERDVVDVLKRASRNSQMGIVDDDMEFVSKLKEIKFDADDQLIEEQNRGKHLGRNF